MGIMRRSVGSREKKLEAYSRRIIYERKESTRLFGTILGEEKTGEGEDIGNSPNTRSKLRGSVTNPRCHRHLPEHRQNSQHLNIYLLLSFTFSVEDPCA